MINITQDILEKLEATAAVTAIASTRIWGDRNTPPKQYRPDDGPALVFSKRGGVPGYDARVLYGSYKFKFYGATNSASISPQLSAFNLYAAVYDTLQDGTFANIRFLGAEMLDQDMEEFALNWPYKLAFFEFVAINGS